MSFLDLTPENVVLAYEHAIFPMDDDAGGETEWFRPDPRAILPLDGFHISRSLARTIRHSRFSTTMDADFAGVMRGCANRDAGTWISEAFHTVYGQLHDRGIAHSVEVRLGDRLVGGTYGLALGAAFMAESMFHYETDASKVALAALVAHLRERQFELLDVQFLTPHLISLGAVEIPLAEYQRRLRRALTKPRSFG